MPRRVRLRERRRSPIYTAHPAQESCIDSPHPRLCESFKCGEGVQFCCCSDAPAGVSIRAAAEVSQHLQRRGSVGRVGLMVFTVRHRCFTDHIKE